MKTRRLKMSAAVMLLIAAPVSAQTYSYQQEGFEEDAWKTAASNPTVIVSSTGSWQVAKNNVRSDEAGAHGGNYALVVKTKSASLTTPVLSHGAGKLEFWAVRNSGTRKITVAASADGTSWTPTSMTDVAVATEWTRYMVDINDPAVRYLRFESNSNSGLFIDDILITTGDGTEVKPTTRQDNSVLIPYWTQGWNDSSQMPSGSSSEETIAVEGQGEWIYSGCKRNTNSAYIADGSASSLRMTKNGSYIITPLLSKGVSALSIEEGRGKRSLSFYTSTDGGATWSPLSVVESKAGEPISIAVNDAAVNRLKISNEGGSDADVDNLRVNLVPTGVKATVSTVGAANIGRTTADATLKIEAAGDYAVSEAGICWSDTEELPIVGDNHVAAAATEGEQTVALAHLPAGRTIYYCAYAISEAGCAYGKTQSLTTDAAILPTLLTLAPQYVTSSTCDARGQIQDDGGNKPSCLGVCYMEGKGMPDAGSDKEVTARLNADNTWSVTLFSLKPATRYTLRAFARNEAGIAYADTLSFTTAKAFDNPGRHVYYVSPDGDDATADGSMQKPFFTLQQPVDKAVAGDSIVMLPGTYHYTARVNISGVGTHSGGYITLCAKPGGRAVLDFSTQALDPNNQGIRLCGSYWHIADLDIVGCGDNGMLIERNKPTGGSYADIAANTDQAHHNVIERCRFIGCRDTGLQMKNLAAYNAVVNCDSYNNCDPDMGDADGFAPKLTVGTGNYFYGCRAWNNSDDGWDGLLTALDNGFPDDVHTTIINCWAFRNGFLADGTAGKGNGNGFKMGGNYERHNQLLVGCLSFDNLMKGFDQNHNTGSMTLVNCTGFNHPYTANKNHYSYRIDEDVLASGKKVTLYNCLNVWDGLEAGKSNQAPSRLSSDAVLVSSEMQADVYDFVSADTTGVSAPRDVDGSLPSLDFMRLKKGSSLVDAGTPVDAMLFDEYNMNGWKPAYSGAAPDLGCFEYVEATSVSTANIPAAAGKKEYVYLKDGLLYVVRGGTAVVLSPDGRRMKAVANK